MNHTIYSHRLAHIYRSLRINPYKISAREMSQRARPPKRFAPLHPEKGKQSDAPKLKGIVFDVDGTLWYELFSALILLCLFVFAALYVDSLTFGTSPAPEASIIFSTSIREIYHYLSCLSLVNGLRSFRSNSLLWDFP